MNIQYLKYAIEVEKHKSISKAAKNLYMGQPNLSRAIKELEDSLGIVIFERTSKGIAVTPNGEEFLQYAKRILSQIDELEEIYKTGKSDKQQFSACVPRAGYIAYAFSELAKSIKTDTPAEIFYKETNSMRAINNVLRGEYNLAIIRYQEAFEKYFESMFKEKNLVAKTITEFSYVLAMSVNNPLAKKEDITPEDLSDYIEIAHADPYVPSLPVIDVKKAEMSEFVDKRIYVFERASQYMLLEQVPNTFMWVSPMPDEMLANNNLVERECGYMKKKYKDVLIYRDNYKLTDIDKKFISLVLKAKEGM
ncbi:MAG: LysR family transcriptional regulator [Clostridia bacterium]|nr:LysR family transcriptional regulator [Clostridia bacterium]MBQ8566729.1 LysR family transcriptional regulator [Clostridia bacterium]